MLFYFSAKLNGEPAFTQINLAENTRPEDAIAYIERLMPDLEDITLDDGPAPEIQPTIGQLREHAKQQVITFADRAASGFVKGYSQAEQKSWPTQEAEARLVLAGNGTPDNAALIYGLAVGADGTIADGAVVAVATSIVRNSTALKAVEVALIKMRQATFAGIDAAQDGDQINAVMANAMNQAQASIAQLTAMMTKAG